MQEIVAINGSLWLPWPQNGHSSGGEELAWENRKLIAFRDTNFVMDDAIDESDRVSVRFTVDSELHARLTEIQKCFSRLAFAGDRDPFWHCSCSEHFRDTQN
jgi:hypothetical protein